VGGLARKYPLMFENMLTLRLPDFGSAGAARSQVIAWKRYVGKSVASR